MIVLPPSSDLREIPAGSVNMEYMPFGHDQTKLTTRSEPSLHFHQAHLEMSTLCDPTFRACDTIAETLRILSKSTNFPVQRPDSWPAFVSYTSLAWFDRVIPTKQPIRHLLPLWRLVF